ncbi:MAG: DUF411 domain-containing protein [Gemmatimonadetes bacterium]|nr:DUF411 domain-containing protein [Gemmatimonadota bacterium]
MRTPILVALAAGVAASLAAGRPAAGPTAETVAAPIMQVYKSATCGCCKSWVEKMKAAGFEVRVTDLDESALQEVKAKRGVGENLQSCHTAVVNGYVVEGHVPAADIHRMLKEKPAIAGIAAPGMPRGSPGMEVPGGAKDPYQVLTFTRSGKTSVFARH